MKTANPPLAISKLVPSRTCGRIGLCLPWGIGWRSKAISTAGGNRRNTGLSVRLAALARRTIGRVGDEEEDRLTGRMGRVTVPIPTGGPGEIIVAIRGGTERYAAWCDEPLAKHTPVVIVSERSARSVDVAPFPEANTL